MNQKATTQHCFCWEHAPRHWLQNNECWRMEDHMPSSAPCWNHMIRKLLQQWAINNHHTSTSDLFINSHHNTTRLSMLHKKHTHLRNYTSDTDQTRHGTPHSLLFIDVLTRSFSNQTQIVLVQIQQPPSTTQTWLESTAQRSTWNTESIHKNRSNNKIGNTSLNKQQCCLVQRVRMHGNLGATQLLRNTLWSRTTNEDSTSLRVTHASLNDTHGGKKTPCNTAWRTAYAVTLCVAHLRCRRDKHRRIEHATRHPVLPRKSMHSLDVTHTNITCTRSSQTTELSTNVNTTNTDSFTHKTTNKTNKNPIRHFHTKHDKLKPSHERTTSRARLSGSKMEPTHRADNKSWRELVTKRRHIQYMKRKLEDQLIAPNKEHELDCFNWPSWNCPMTQTKPQHAKRTATQNMCPVVKKTETLKSETFDLRRLPTLTRTSHVPRNALEKNKNAPNTRNAFWHSINSRLSHSDSQNKHSNTTISHTSHVAKETSESKRRCVSSETSASDLYIDWHPWLHAHHTKTHATQAWKKTTRNKRKERNATTRRHRQIWPRKTAVRQLRFGNKIEIPEFRAPRAWIISILGALWTTTLICLAKHGTRIGGWTLIADADVTNGQKSNLQRQIHLRRAHRRTSMNSHTEQR